VAIKGHQGSERKGVTALIVDDDAQVRAPLRRILEGEGHRCIEAADGTEARRLLGDGSFDLVLCDVNMPGESGVELLQHIMEQYPEAAVVMVTGMDDPRVAAYALESGAYGYVVKPFTSNEIVINVNSALYRRQLERENAQQRAELAATVRDRTDDLANALLRAESTDTLLRGAVFEMMHRLSLATELRDPETANHIERMSRYADLLARKVGWDDDASTELMLASRLHDAGKISIPDRVLRKAGAYTDYEFSIMKTHSDVGYRLFAGSDAPLLQLASKIAWTHHERFDGNGYPRGIAGQAIPLEGRIAAIADVFDALTSRRSYKEAYDTDKVIRIMRNERAKHFDGDLLDVFLESMDDALAIRTSLPDRV
jgi:putative two-component system response regulator